MIFNKTFLMVTVALALVTQLSLAQEAPECKKQEAETCAQPHLTALLNCNDEACECKLVSNLMTCYEQNGCTVNSDSDYAMYKEASDVCNETSGGQTAQGSGV